ncbi:MAG: hypothetical protein AB1634_07205 [Thermodesulfobacteriota bacterium]
MQTPSAALFIIGAVLLTMAPAAADQLGLDYPHSAPSGIGCDSCHYIVSNDPPAWVTHVPQNADDTAYNNMCWGCHNDVRAPYVSAHSSLATSDTHGTWSIECRVCHWPHHQMQARTYGSAAYLASGVSTALDSDSLTMAGAGWSGDQLNSHVLVPNLANPSYSYTIIDTTADTLTVDGPMDLAKAAAGNTFAVYYGKLIKSTVPTPNSGSRTVRLFRKTGANSYADGDGTRDGVCEVCHTQTTHFRNDGTGSTQNHENLGGKAGTSCIDCHAHTNGFGHGGGGGGGNGSGCSGQAGCHQDQKSHPTHLAGMLAGVDCLTCHQEDNFPAFADGETLANTTACNHCHSPGGMVDGVNDPAVGAKNNFDTGVYDGNALKAGKELFCISCHDEDPANDKQDGSGTAPAPNKAGDNASYGYYVNGHGLDSALGFNATLHGQNGPDYACLVCHDRSASPHINRTYGDTRLKAVAGDGLDSTSAISEVCLDCHKVGQSANGALGYDATAEATVHSGGITGNYDSAAQAANAFPAYGNSADYAAAPGYQCEDCHEVHGTTRLAMVLPAIDGRVGGASNPVDIAGLEASDTDLRDLDPSAAANDGVCDACHGAAGQAHPDTNHPGNHNQGNTGASCMPCHSHQASFAHGGGAAGGASCGDLACHGGSGSHAGHLTDAGLACTDCHDLADMPHFKDGGTTKDNTTVCADCHHDGTVVATGNKVLMPPPDWFSGQTLTCAGCHDSGPSYPSAQPKANTHAAHSGFSCDTCHSATTADGTTITGSAHLNDQYNLKPGTGVSFIYLFGGNGGLCASISCHGGTEATWGDSACLGCHRVAQNGRAAIGPQFDASSHHVQGIAVTGAHCYPCHWEANSDGSINPTYHGGSFNSGAPVDLVVYGPGERPTSYNTGTAISYHADGSRAEIARLNTHCLSCHSDPNNDTEPFGDCNTPRQYAWDRSSIAARYSQTGVTTWGKYAPYKSSYPRIAAKDLSKAFSAHGNAVGNEGGWSSVDNDADGRMDGLDAEIANTRAGSLNVLCFDCHNAHGSAASGTTSSYVSFNGTPSGALLKSTTAGRGGYAVTYTPQANSDGSDHNPYATGADLCFDCHLSPTALATPWGFSQTFGAAAAIKGYKDGDRFGTSLSGTKERFPYRAGRDNMGGHLMASASLNGLDGTPGSGDEAVYPINGLCTPCHDPHGVSPSLGSKQSYGVPLLKGTWMTSPYQEDSPNENTANVGATRGERQTEHDDPQRRHWNTDRVTFNANPTCQTGDAYTGITEDDATFAGLCLRCHPKTRLTNGTDKDTGWKTVDRIHETVKDWGNNAEHNFPCSKCHVPHNAGLPRLMQTNCLNKSHRGGVVAGGHAIEANKADGGYYGFFPGIFYGLKVVDERNPLACHETASAFGGGGPGGGQWPDNELWNSVTPW